MIPPVEMPTYTADMLDGMIPPVEMPNYGGADAAYSGDLTLLADASKAGIQVNDSLSSNEQVAVNTVPANVQHLSV